MIDPGDEYDGETQDEGKDRRSDMPECEPDIMSGIEGF
jgi:hypothetical protein